MSRERCLPGALAEDAGSLPLVYLVSSASSPSDNMHHTSLLASLCLVSTSAWAQQNFTVPVEANTTEPLGSEVGTVHPFYAANSRFQFSTSDMKGLPRLSIHKLEMRRDGDTATGLYPSRTLNVAVVMAHTNMAAATTTFANNYVGTATTVFERKPYNLPDHGSAPVPVPAPWSIVLQFDTSFSYDGTQDLLWELQTDGTTIPNQAYSLDTIDELSGGTGSFKYLDTLGKCYTPNGMFDIYARAPMTSQAGMCTITNYALRGPSNASSAWVFGLHDLNVTGLFCAPWRPSFDVMIPFVSGPRGEIGTSVTPLSVSFPFAWQFAGYTQFVALDGTQRGLPFAVSDAVKQIAVAYTPGYQVSRLSAVSTTTLPPALDTGSRSGLYVPVSRFSY